MKQKNPVRRVFFVITMQKNQQYKKIPGRGKNVTCRHQRCPILIERVKARTKAPEERH